MNLDLQTCLHILESGSLTEYSFRAVLDDFLAFTTKTESVAENRSDAAMVFCRILCACQLLYDIDAPEKLPDDIKGQIILSFNNIEHLFLGISRDELRGSYVRTVWFLSELKTKASEGRTGEISQQVIGEHARDLLDILCDIRFVFDIKDEKGLLFPINKVIAAVISGRDFQEFRKGIQVNDIYTLRLAVRLFHTDEDERILETLKTQCNLAFINYLCSDCEIIDTIDFLNYRSNGIMVFHNARAKKVLIRSEHKQYFSTSDAKGHTLQTEYDCDRKAIGWFVEYDLAEQDILCDYSDLLKNESDRIALLRLFYDYGYRNIFLQKSIILKPDHTITPINPYCKQDTFLVQGWINNRNGKTYRANELRSLLQKYRICSVKSNVMNRVSLGLCSLLLDINNIGVESLGLDKLDNDSWYQEQVIINWISRSETTVDHFSTLVEEWYKQLQYCESTDFIDKRYLQAQDFFPLKHNLFALFQKICPSIALDEKVFSGKVVEEDVDSFILEVNLNDTVAGKEERRQGKKYLAIDVNCLQNEDEHTNWELQTGTDVWFLYSISAGTGHVFNHRLLKLLAGVELIQIHCLPFSVGSHIITTDYEGISSYMELFKDAMRSVANKTDVCSQEDFSSQIYIRLLHNMIWSKLDSKEKTNDYLDILFAHQKADFSKIECDSVFQRTDKTCLYVPKDAYSQSSVLSAIYEKRLHPEVERDCQHMYQAKLEKTSDGKFAVFGHTIEKIVLLTDNVAGGKSTIAALSANLMIEEDPEFGISSTRVKQADSTRHKYYCGDQEVPVVEILKTNNVPVSVHAYYGTDEGCKLIDSFLEKHNIPHDHSSFYCSLTNKADEGTIEKAKSLWIEKGEILIKPGQYFYIREYNMPRMTIFPKRMLEDFNLCFSLFNRKKELNEVHRN